MIKKDLKCPQCGKTLLRLYGAAVRSVTCACRCSVDLKQKQQKRKEMRQR